MKQRLDEQSKKLEKMKIFTKDVQDEETKQAPRKEDSPLLEEDQQLEAEIEKIKGENE